MASETRREWDLKCSGVKNLKKSHSEILKIILEIRKIKGCITILFLFVFYWFDFDSLHEEILTFNAWGFEFES